jgi:nascent polypeptide-associated complex subunit alpha
MFNLNPKKMQAMMKQLGMKNEEIEAKRVIIEQEDKNIIIDNPNVVKILMQGQESWQITGETREETREDKEKSRESDIRQVIEKTSCSRKQAEQALEKADGDLAGAILSLS